LAGKKNRPEAYKKADTSALVFQVGAQSDVPAFIREIRGAQLREARTWDLPGFKHLDQSKSVSVKI